MMKVKKVQRVHFGGGSVLRVWEKLESDSPHQTFRANNSNRETNINGNGDFEFFSFQQNQKRNS